MSERPDPSTERESVARLRERLERSRAQLLEALAQLTEQDFASEIEERRSVLDLLAELAPAERSAAAEARAAAGLAARAAPPPATRRSLLAPQVIHDLAGARHETLLTLAELQQAGGAVPAALPAVAEREEQAGAAILDWFRGRRA